MDRIADAIAVARELIATYGPRAAATVDQRVAEHERAGDRDGALFWAKVARAVRGLQALPSRPMP